MGGNAGRLRAGRHPSEAGPWLTGAVGRGASSRSLLVAEAAAAYRRHRHRRRTTRPEAHLRASIRDELFAGMSLVSSAGMRGGLVIGHQTGCRLARDVVWVELLNFALE